MALGHGRRLGFLVVLAVGCGDDPIAAPETGSTGGTSPGAESSTSSGEHASSTSDGDDSSSGSGSGTTTGGEAFDASLSVIATLRDADDMLSVVRVDYGGGLVNTPEPLTDQVRRFASFLEVSPQGTALSYETFDPGDALESYVVGLDGGRPLATSHLTDPERPDLAESRFIALTPDESRVIFSASDEDGDVYRTYIADIAGGELGAPDVLVEGTFSQFELSFSSDGTQVAFFAHGPNAVYTASTSGPVAPTELVGLGTAHATFGPTFGAGDSVVWYQTSARDQPEELAYVDLAAPGSAVTLYSASAPEELYRAEVSPDRRWVAFHATTDGIGHLYAVRFDGTTVSEPLLVSSSADPETPTSWVGWSPDASWLAFVDMHEDPNARDMYLVDMRGDVPGLPVLVTAPSVGAGGSAYLPRFDPSSTWLYYGVYTEAGDSTLFRASVGDGVPGDPQVVSTGLDWTTDMRGVGQISPDGTGIVILEDISDGTYAFAPWFVDVSGPSPGTPLRIGPDLPSSVAQPLARWSTDSQSIVFDVHPSGYPPAMSDYYVVERDGLETPVALGTFEELVVTEPLVSPRG